VVVTIAVPRKPGRENSHSNLEFMIHREELTLQSFAVF
jgi:hypothetical protein